MKLLPALALLAIPSGSLAQTSQLVTAAPQKVSVRRGENVEAVVTFHLRAGYHVNSNAPNEDYLRPLRLKWEPGTLAASEVVYPKAEQRNYSFSAKPVAVFTGDFRVVTRFKADASAPPGPGVVIGKLSYQACNENTCFRPATLEVRLPFEIH